MKIVKIVQVISSYKKRKSIGQVEAICLMSDGTLQARHIYPTDVPK